MEKLLHTLPIFVIICSLYFSQNIFDMKLFLCLMMMIVFSAHAMESVDPYEKINKHRLERLNASGKKTAYDSMQKALVNVGFYNFFMNTGNARHGFQKQTISSYLELMTTYAPLGHMRKGDDIDSVTHAYVKNFSVIHKEKTDRVNLDQSSPGYKALFDSHGNTRAIQAACLLGLEHLQNPTRTYTWNDITNTWKKLNILEGVKVIKYDRTGPNGHYSDLWAGKEPEGGFGDPYWSGTIHINNYRIEKQYQLDSTTRLDIPKEALNMSKLPEGAQSFIRSHKLSECRFNLEQLPKIQYDDNGKVLSNPYDPELSIRGHGLLSEKDWDHKDWETEPGISKTVFGHLMSNSGQSYFKDYLNLLLHPSGTKNVRGISPNDGRLGITGPQLLNGKFLDMLWGCYQGIGNNGRGANPCQNVPPIVVAHCCVQHEHYRTITYADKWTDKTLRTSYSKILKAILDKENDGTNLSELIVEWMTHGYGIKSQEGMIVEQLANIVF
jgi:hypothetical protein